MLLTEPLDLPTLDASSYCNGKREDFELQYYKYRGYRHLEYSPKQLQQYNLEGIVRLNHPGGHLYRFTYQT